MEPTDAIDTHDQRGDVSADPTPRAVLVTGGGRGIGKSIAARFATSGSKVAIADLDAELARSAAAEIGLGSIGIGCDVTDRDSVTHTFDRIDAEFGRLDVIVHNVGVARNVSFEDMTDDDWNFQVDVTLRSAFVVAQIGLPRLTTPGGNIVFIGSVNGFSAFGHEAYSAAKAGIVSLSQNLAVRNGPRGIRSNVVVPGTIQTEVWIPRLRQDPEVLTRMSRHYPLRRIGTPGDVAAAVSFLASVEASWISGIALPVDGGLLAGSLAMAEDTDLRPSPGA
ncbi:SDR family NAD(P)-dependent oxidoreductase [Kribbella sp. VKM Ac-2566]|uniref:SDR family NAD(P)-dependent oxidoreductase n=1 Tax=Kribbella sp. VKM Ac-2566 TaxID=2512218 RepID=UPI001062CCC9|nr:SDR family oxidoreductase [Kribbella sp. VKM Ac-2566]TDX08323.1 NAD(P)-dependent dehydrogenase (short-subunit alcohol dehydrogenase family) [Kribbella sp. VKM Ac-2566]